VNREFKPINGDRIKAAAGMPPLLLFKPKGVRYGVHTQLYALLTGINYFADSKNIG
jgi:hypothetical protein